MKHLKTVNKVLRYLQIIVVVILSVMMVRAMTLLYSFMKGESLF